MNDVSTSATPTPGPAAVRSGPVFVPSLRYGDAARAIDWLIEAFGFTKLVAYANDDGTIAHAELAFGSGVVMLGSGRPDGAWAQRTPQELGGATTGGVYVILEHDEDIDAHCARARGAGAEIIQEPESPDYGGRSYAARDPQGHLWSFGTYRSAL